MKTKYSIGLFLFVTVIIYILSFEISEKLDKNQTETEQLISTDGNAKKEDCYYLFEENGYVVVYESDKNTPYEYTNILYTDLPEILKQEIKNGKYIKNTEELYGFLENYSS